MRVDLGDDVDAGLSALETALVRALDAIPDTTSSEG
jgi:hypothetical protein